MKWIKTKTEEYEKSLDLREEHLTKPIGLTIERETLQENDAGLLTAWNGDECVGAMVMTKYDD